MGFLEVRSEATSGRVARRAAERGLLFKRGAYNFVSLAHDSADVARALDILDAVLQTNP
jgi:glutamate-1-semialdehyde aminotransferase